jgi:hypothetical protein
VGAVIPRVAHFVWLNAELPWVHALALSSASRYGGFSRLVLHHDQAFDGRSYRALARIDKLELRRIDAPALLVGRSRAKARRALYARYLRLGQAAARSNVLRVAILAREGGVYLDMDTITVRELSSLCARSQVFCGTEHVAFPASLYQRPQLSRCLAAAARSSLRAVLARLPDGFRLFRRVAELYPLAANNAILGAEPEHPLLVGLLERMAAMGEDEAARRFALGTHLLQAALAAYTAGGLTILPPAAFYPLGPVMSDQWFRCGSTPRLGEVVSLETRVVHWYASLRTERQQRALSPRWVHENASRQLFSALVQKLGLA